MCPCGHTADDHHPTGRCFLCHRDCGVRRPSQVWTPIEWDARRPIYVWRPASEPAIGGPEWPAS